MCVHDGAWCKSLVPPYFWKVRMANLNCEAILASPRYVCGREKKLHTCAHARLAGHGVAKYAAHDVCVNGPPKSGSNKFTRYGRSNRFPNLITDPITRDPAPIYEI